MTADYRNIFFDLDGTIVDSTRGIVDSMNYALNKLGYNSAPDSEIIKLIGAPLEVIFQHLLSIDDPKIEEQGILFYRENYSIDGIKKADPYNGIEEMLVRLCDHSCKLYIASTKRSYFSEAILTSLNFISFFTEIIGPDKLAIHSDNKAALIESLITKHKIDPTTAIMVGDRKFDLSGAQENGIDSIGVTYGFGSKEELLKANATFIANSPAQIADYILQ